MRHVHLTPCTVHAYDLLQKHGEIWHIRRIEVDGTILLESLRKTFAAYDPENPNGTMQTDWRWVHLHEDPYFEVTILKNLGGKLL